MNELTKLSKRFCELVGICWHEWDYYELLTLHETQFKCRRCHELRINDRSHPDFSDPREVLRVMRGREDFRLFPCVAGDGDIHIDLILDTTGLLLKEAVSYLEGK